MLSPAPHSTLDPRPICFNLAFQGEKGFTANLSRSPVMLIGTDRKSAERAAANVDMNSIIVPILVRVRPSCVCLC